MRIIFLEAVQNFGGARKSTLELAKRMQDLGHDILIVDFWGCVLPFIQKLEEYDLNYSIIDKREEPILISDPSRLKKISNALSYTSKQIQYRLKFDSIVESFKPDIVSVNNSKCLSILNSKSSYNIDFFVRGWFETTKIPLRSRMLLKTYQPRFITVSQASRQSIYLSGMAKLQEIEVLHSVIDSKAFYNYNLDYKEFNKDNPIKILHSGGFLPSKGQHIAIEVAKTLKQQSVHYKLILTGIIYAGDLSSKYYKEVLQLIELYGLQNHVEIVLNKSDIIKYFRGCDILIHPSTTEGLPRVILESLSFGKPVIANPVGGVIDLVHHNFTGYISDFNDINQYVTYIKSYINNLDLYTEHSKNCRSFIRQNYLDESQYALIHKIYPLVI